MQIYKNLFRLMYYIIQKLLVSFLNGQLPEKPTLLLRNFKSNYTWLFY